MGRKVVIMDILELIPVGRDNAITGQYLQKITGLSERALRNEIEVLRREHCIANEQNAKGYFRPETIEEAVMQLNQTRNRAKSLYIQTHPIKKLIKSLAGQTAINI